MYRPTIPVAVACAAGVVAVVSVGCATGPVGQVGSTAPDGIALAWPEGSGAYAALVALRDSESPSASPQPVVQMRGLDPEALSPIAPERAARAGTPLPDALAELREARPGAVESVAAAPREGALVRAGQLYASGLARLLDGDPAGAARDLSAAAQLDPASPEPWVKLAEAQAMLGESGASMLSRRRAADLGADDAMSLAVIGLQAARTGQHELAAHYLARCLGADPRGADPLLQQVALVRLADPLAHLGYLRASIGALREGLDLPARLDAPTRFAVEAGDIARQASDLWRQIGDTACRLGDDALAAEAYATAAGSPSVDPGAILLRRAFVLLRSGRRAAAALLVIDDIAARGGRAGTHDLTLLAALRDDGVVGARTAQALADLDRSITGGRTATTERMLALAAAAVSPGDRARALLARRAAEAPGDARTLGALFARCETPAAIEAEALRLVEATPAAAGAVAEAMLPWHPSPGPLCESLPETPAGRLLRMRLSMALGRPAVALEESAPVAGPSFATAIVEARAVAAAGAGAWDEFDALLPMLEGSPEARARALRAAQRPADALASLAAALEVPDASLDSLLLGAELSLGVGDRSRAAALLDRAKAIDPFDERVYEGLVNVRQAAEDAPGAAEAVRELRERAPSSALLRWVGVQEDARRGLPDQAERSARALVEDSGDSGPVLGLLMSIWAQRKAVGDTASLESAADWLEGLTDEMPVTGEQLAARGTLLQLLGRTDEAEAVLRQAHADRPTPAVSRAWENLLLATGRSGEAGAVAEARFVAWGAGIDASLELAQHRAREGRWDEAARAALAAMPGRARLTARQQGGILQFAGELAGQLQRSPLPELNAATLTVLNSVEAHGIGLDWQLSYARWALLANSPAAAEQVVAATESFLGTVTSLEIASPVIGDVAGQLGVSVETLDQARGQIAYQLASTLAGTGHEDAALDVYRAALRYSPDHAWAANDLGYFLTERHEHLEEAATLLGRAYALRPDQSNIADSLGWFRYKLGQFDSEPLPDGSVREGAVSLLLAASGLPGGTESATVHDHLGDALWRTGEHERAKAAWLRAQQLLVGELTALRDGGSSRRRNDLTARASGVVGKLEAAAGGDEPAVASLFGEGTTPE